MKSLFAALLVFLIGLACASCSSTSVSVVPTRGALSDRLDRLGKVYILNPDYSGNDFLSVGSQHIIGLLKTSFEHKTYAVTTAPAATDLARLLEKARADKYGYIVSPSVTEWKTRDDKPNGKPSKVAYQLKVYRVSDGTELYGVNISGELGSLTTTAESLLETPVEQFVNSLY